MKLDGIWGGAASYPGKPYCTGIESCRRCHKTEPIRRTRSGQGAEGGRSTGSTEDSGPVKPGNSVEGKTMKTREGEGRRPLGSENPPLATVNTQLSRGIRQSETQAWVTRWRRWVAGSRGRKAMVTPAGSRMRVVKEEEGTRKPKGDGRIPEGIPTRGGLWKVNSHPVPAHEGHSQPGNL